MIKLYINDEIVDFQLEKEKNIEELYQSLDNWCNQQKNVIIDFFIDGQDFFKEDVKEKLIKDTKDVKLYIKKITHFCFEIIIEIEKQIITLKKTLKDKNTYDTLDSLKELIIYIKSSLDNILSIYSDYDNSILEDVRLLEIEVFKVEEQKDYKINKTYLEQYSEIVNRIEEKIKIFNFYSYTYYLIQEFRDNHFSKDVFYFFKKEIKELIEKIFIVQIEIAKNFQIGDDKKAVSWLLPFIDAFAFVIYLIENISQMDKMQDDEKIKKLKQNLEDNLREIEEAFKNKDYVSISDLIEYELKDQLNIFLELIPNNFINGILLPIDKGV